ncbi:MAG TPA: hypothetical protein VGH40_04845 [Roseiarcus sp.]|jgi:hypothetical protein
MATARSSGSNIETDISASKRIDSRIIADKRGPQLRTNSERVNAPAGSVGMLYAEVFAALVAAPLKAAPSASIRMSKPVAATRNSGSSAMRESNVAACLSASSQSPTRSALSIAYRRNQK